MSSVICLAKCADVVDIGSEIRNYIRIASNDMNSTLTSPRRNLQPPLTPVAGYVGVETTMLLPEVEEVLAVELGAMANDTVLVPSAIISPPDVGTLKI